VEKKWVDNIKKDVREIGCHIKRKKEGKAIPVIGREGPVGFETSRLPHFLDNRLTVGGEVVSLTRQPPFTPRKIPGTEAESTARS
jgi:hypothetical protein